MKILFLIFSIFMLSWTCKSQQLNAGLGVNLMVKNQSKSDYRINFAYQNNFLSDNSGYGVNKLYGYSPYISYFTKKWWKYEISSSALYLHYFQGRVFDFTIGKGFSRMLVLEGGLSIFKGKYDEEYTNATVGRVKFDNSSYSSGYSGNSQLNAAYQGINYGPSTPSDSIPASYQVDKMTIPYLKLGASVNIRRFTFGAHFFIPLKKLKIYTLDYGTTNYDVNSFFYRNIFIKYNILSKSFSKDQSTIVRLRNQVVPHWRFRFTFGLELLNHYFTSPITSFFIAEPEYSPYGTEEVEPQNNLSPGYTYDYVSVVRSSPLINFGVQYSLTKKMSLSTNIGFGTIAFRHNGITVNGGVNYFNNLNQPSSLFWKSNDDFSPNNIWLRANLDASYVLYQNTWSLSALAGISLNHMKYHWAIPGYVFDSNNGFRGGVEITNKRINIKLYAESFFGLSKSNPENKISYYMLGTSLSYTLVRLKNFNNTILK